MTTADPHGGSRTVERVILAMVAARVAMSARDILYALAFGQSEARLWWGLFAVLAIAYVLAAWRYPLADLRWRRALLLLAFIDLGLTGYETHLIWGSQFDGTDEKYYLVTLSSYLIQFVPGLVVAALVGKSLANMRQTRPDDASGSFALPDGTVIELGSDEDY